MKSELELPTDLYRPIVQHLGDSKTLVSLALTSKVFHQEAIQHLYHTLRLAWIPFATQKKCLSTISHSAKYADLVRTFTFTPREAPDGPLCEQGDEYWELLAAGLSALKNLTTLGFPGDLPSFAPSILLPHCSMPKLTLFMWPPLTGENELIPFFERHPNIRQIQLSWGRNPDVLLRNPHVLPRLNRIWGSTSALNALLPDRKVPNVEWIGSPLGQYPSQATLESLRDVRMLLLGGYGRPSGAFLPDLAPYLNNLEVLLIMEFEAADDLVTQISHLSRLRRLVFVWGHGDRSCIERLFWAGSRTLEVIAVCWDDEEAFEEYRPRWFEQDGGTQLQVSHELVGDDWEIGDEVTDDR
ncbi:hypothetical protein BDN72DRAFT_839605 [Pluteus cervinus]|uniref:Uncharacterized protein n=1 Tax=Pluteus cervinus TaxID=181527 RepID=A0ACD3AXJ0_9AGAR|nr:hypothetical protein BDN72DRAFT_839605 [Pluteus cervinus]